MISSTPLIQPSNLGLLAPLLDQLPTGIAFFDRDLRLRYCNPAYAGFVRRYTHTEIAQIVPGAHFLELAPGSGETAVPVLQRALGGEMVRQDGMPLESEGLLSYWDVVVAPLVEDGQVVGLINVSTDATERVKAYAELEGAARALKQEQDRFNLVMQGTNEGIWDWQIESGQVYFSPRWKGMLGYAEDEIANTFEAWRQLVHPDDLPRVTGELEAYLAGRAPAYVVEHRLRHKDGSYRWIMARGAALRDASGRAYRMAGSHTDITERREAEGQREIALEALRHHGALDALVTSISTDFINLASDQVDAGIDGALRAIGEFAGVDRSYVFLFAEDNARLDNTHEWCAEGLSPMIEHFQALPLEALPWLTARILQLESVHVPKVSEMPPEAAVEKQEQTLEGVRSFLVVPLVYRGRAVGFMGFDAIRGEKNWPDESITLLRIVGEIFVNALERKRAEDALQESQRALERRVEERTRELSTLLQVTHDAVSTLELEPLLDVILEQLHSVVEYDGASILIQEDDGLRVIAYRGPIPHHQVVRIRFPLAAAGPNSEVMRRGEPIIIDDVRGTSMLARSFQRSAGDQLETTFGYIRSWLGVPLEARGRLIGMLSLDHGQLGRYQAGHARLASAFADQVAAAIDNARLYEAEQERRAEVERRRQVAEGLRDILALLNAHGPLDEILIQILCRAGQLLDTDAAAVFRLQSDKRLLSIQAAQGLPADYVSAMKIPVGEGAVGAAVARREPVVVTDFAGILALGLKGDPVRRKHFEWLASQYRLIVAVPLTAKSETYGGIVFYFHEMRELTQEEMQLATSFADQAALAIESDRLRDQAEQAAVAAERSRLARDLHDAVTQTLFSASLIAEVLPRLWERSPDEGRKRLEELRQLTRGALAEMRTLLLELRPTALTEATLADLLRQLGEALTGRARVPVHLTVEGHGLLQPDIQIALYRIAQEALNNVAKHSAAASVRVVLRYLAAGPTEPGISGNSRAAREGVSLSIVDDGCGFDATSIPPDHLGLGIMRERADAIGAVLQIDSELGCGTQVTIEWRG